jgi:hypothetical protein
MNNEELRTLVNQFDTGALTAIEFLLKVQLTQEAVKNLLYASKLPAAAQLDLDVGTLMHSDDEVIESQFTAANRAARDVACNIMDKLELEDEYTTENADFKFYCLGTEIGVTAETTIQNELSRFLSLKNRNTFTENGRLWFERMTLDELFGPIPKDFAPTLWTGKRGKQVDESEPKKSLKITYVRELLDWIGIEHTSARLRSFRFYRYQDGFGIGIYTSDTAVRRYLNVALKEGKIPHTITANITYISQKDLNAMATNIKPPQGLPLEEAKT